MPIWFLVAVAAGFTFAGFSLLRHGRPQVHNSTRIIAAIIIVIAFVLLLLDAIGLFQFGD